MLSLIATTCIFALTVAAALVAFGYGRGGKKKKKLALPGPPTWPIVGNFWQLDSKRPDLSMAEWGRTIGPVYKLQILTTDYVVATSYEAVYELLVTKGKSFAGRGKPFRRMLVSQQGRDIVLGDPTKPHWNVLRKALQKIMRQYGDGEKVERIIAQMVSEFLATMSSYDGQPVDIRKDIYNFTTKAAFVLIQGRKPSDDDPLLEKAKQYERSLIQGVASTKGLELDCFPWLRFFGHPLYPKLLSAVRLVDDMFGQLWACEQDKYVSGSSDASAGGGDGEAGDEEDNTYMLHAACQMMDEQSPNYQPALDREHMKALFMNIIIGSVASTTATAYALPNIFLHNPRVYRLVQEEVEKVVGWDKKPASGDRERMPYTAATVLELARYTSILPSFTHVTLEDTTLQGHVIPAGTPVLPVFAAVHHDDAFWGDPWVFRPERFLLENGSIVPADHPNRKRVLAFGAGPRVCPGEVFALKRLFVFTASLAQAFDLHPGDEPLVTCDPRDYATGNVLHPLPYKVKFIPRHAAPS